MVASVVAIGTGVGIPIVVTIAGPVVGKVTTASVVFKGCLSVVIGTTGVGLAGVSVVTTDIIVVGGFSVDVVGDPVGAGCSVDVVGGISVEVEVGGGASVDVDGGDSVDVLVCGGNSVVVNLGAGAILFKIFLQ